MSDGEVPLVGVVAVGAEAADHITDAVEGAGGNVVTGAAENVIAAEPTAIVAVGEPSFIRVATHEPGTPVVPVGVGRGVRSISTADVPAAIDRVLAGAWMTERHPLLAVHVAGERRGRAVTDVTVITAEAAHISEYRVNAADTTLGRVRADGIVVATPAGSSGYARRIGAPVIEPGTGAVVAPVAPFSTDPDHWVVDPDGVSIEQTRDEAGVELVVDDTEVGPLDPDETVACRVDGHVSTVVVPESRSRDR